MSNNIVSVIVPIYKVENYLNKCVTRLVNQSYNDLQIILVDDGSPDGCPQICDQWARKDARIEVIHKNNGGLSDARNAGLKAAKGEYVCFVDSDDYISINMVEKMHSAMLEHQADMVICQFVSVTLGGVASRIKPVHETQILTPGECLRLLLKDFWITNHAWRRMYKKELLPEKPFPVGMNYEDVYVMADLTMACKKIVSLSEAYYYYLNNTSGILHTVTKKNTRNLEQAFEHSFDSILAQHPEMKNEIEIKRKEVKKLTFRLYLKSSKGIYKILHSFGSVSRRIKRISSEISESNRILKEIKNIPSPRFFIFSTPHYGNLGDRALTVGEDAFIKTYFPDYTIVHVPLNILNKFFLSKVKNIISEKDKISFQAGGNFGSLYPGIHRIQEMAIAALKEFPVVVFPQTVYYGNDTTSQAMLKKTKHVYQSCPNLTLTLREKVSYDFVKKNFPKTKALLIPDMVLNVPEFHTDMQRNGALICLRNDAEATLSDEDYSKLLAIVRNRFEQLEESDTHVYYALSDEEAEIQLHLLWSKMAASEIVITDRLHGMVFAALTKTPCVCIMSKSHKIKGCYEWIKNLEYIALVEHPDQLKSAIEKVISVEKTVYDVTEIRRLYQNLADVFLD